MARNIANKDELRRPTSFTLGKTQRGILAEMESVLHLSKSAILERLLDLVDVGEVPMDTVLRAPMIAQQRRAEKQAQPEL